METQLVKNSIKKNVNNENTKSKSIISSKLESSKSDLKEEQSEYNKLFDAKIYIPTLKANKEEIEFLSTLIINELEKKESQNIYADIINLLCTRFESYVGLFAKLWNQCKALLIERLILIELFKQLKIPLEIVTHFLNYGCESVETLFHISIPELEKIQKWNNVVWLPGHTFRLKIVFSRIHDYVQLFLKKNEDYIRKLKNVQLKNMKKTKLTHRLILPKENRKMVNENKIISFSNKIPLRVLSQNFELFPNQYTQPRTYINNRLIHQHINFPNQIPCLSNHMQDSKNQWKNKLFKNIF